MSLGTDDAESAELDDLRLLRRSLSLDLLVQFVESLPGCEQLWII